MNNFLGFNQWQELFNEDVSKAYNDEKIPMLKDLSMMLFCISREINKIQSDLYKEASILRSCIENVSHDPVGYSGATKYSHSITSPKEQDENIPNIRGSPEIKKKHRHDFKMKLKKRKVRKLLKDFTGVASNINKNPVVVNTSDSDLDTSIVQATPEAKEVVFKSNNKMPSNFTQRRIHKEKNTPRSQMFFINDCNRDSEADVRYDDSDETIVTLNDSDSVMGITKMVSYLNSGLNSKSNDSDIAIASVRYEDFEENDTSLNSAMIEMNYDMSKEHKDLNAFLEKAQNVPQQLDAEPVVRGKARKKLPGWACKDCEKFYVNQGLNADEIMVLNKCSKHRGYFRPREDTLPGFWSMDLSSQKGQNT